MSNVDTFRYYASQLNLTKAQLEAVTECCKACLEATSKDDFQPEWNGWDKPEWGKDGPIFLLNEYDEDGNVVSRYLKTLKEIKEIFAVFDSCSRQVDKVAINEYRVTGPSETGEIETHTWRIEPYQKYYDPHHQFGKPDDDGFNINPTKPDSYYNHTPEERSALRRDVYQTGLEQPDF